MICPDHECWWTKHRTSELTRRGSAVSGAGVSLPALEYAARTMGSPIVVTTSSSDEHALDISIGAQSGVLHDGCMFSFPEVTSELIAGLIAGMLQHHAAYLDSDQIPDALTGYIADYLVPGTTLRITAQPARRSLSVKAYPASASWLKRRFATSMELRVLT